MTTTPSAPSVATSYALGRTTEEYDRVRRQAELWEAATERVLDRVDLPEGARCLDAGCGPGVTMRQLAQRVGPDGLVVGIDSDAELGALGVRLLHEAGHRQCAFHVHDLRSDDPVPGGPFDLVYVRLVLFHLPHRGEVLTRLWDAVRPGGTLVVQDYDLSVVSAVPQLPSAQAVCDLLLRAFSAAGCEVRVGSLLPRLFDVAGIGRPDGTDVAGRLDPLATAGRMLEGTFRSLLPAAIAHDLVTESDAEMLLVRLADDMTADPEHPLLWPLLVGAWKRKPA
ncbi:putative Methyltransferase type 11 [Nostocoides japonicum T1-X7]|uniref:Putative Methyltransferase type 11 n=1 Tax=Nostocoides japonicum T1-X7 TaxID=1194083 RepID=A0A077LUE6_9MICO|nr:methyltransferase domain-containing protein [Tetrasphaera japonica]CCH77433.1 putative Methyltransferase type 11 [Tetrasphaera japonica T1-X7]